MSTFSQLTDQVIMYLQGFTVAQDQSTYLTESVASGATTIKVNETSVVSRGVVEIEDELLYVDQVDSTSQNCSIPPYGRGFQGTTAAAHSSGARVTNAPMFPRVLVKQAINDSIRAVYPDLYGVGASAIAFSPAQTTYALPTGAEDVLAVAWQTTGPSEEWVPLRRYRVDKNAAPTEFASGASLSIYDSVMPGASIRVVYSMQPAALSSNSDEFTTVTGLPASSEDLIRLGAAYRLIPFLDSPHLQGMSSEADFSANQRPTGGSAQLGRYMLQLYQVRLQEEIRRLAAQYPPRSYYTR